MPSAAFKLSDATEGRFRMTLNHRITDLVQKLGTAFGVHVTRADNTLPFKRQSLMHQLGIDVVLDVGANVGNYAAELRAHGFDGRIVSFEPISEVYAELARQRARDPRWRGMQMALGDVDGQTEINVSHNLVSSSLLKVTKTSVAAASSTAIRTVESIRVARLDTVRQDLLKPGERVYMKIDVQGFERQVLAGAAASLEAVAALELELSLVELYAGQALMPEMMNLAGSLGYRPAWLERGFKDPANGHLLQMDGIFLRDPVLRG